MYSNAVSSRFSLVCLKIIFSSRKNIVNYKCRNISFIYYRKIESIQTYLKFSDRNAAAMFSFSTKVQFRVKPAVRTRRAMKRLFLRNLDGFQKTMTYMRNIGMKSGRLEIPHSGSTAQKSTLHSKKHFHML